MWGRYTENAINKPGRGPHQGPDLPEHWSGTPQLTKWWESNPYCSNHGIHDIWSWQPDQTKTICEVSFAYRWQKLNSNKLHFNERTEKRHLLSCVRKQSEPIGLMLDWICNLKWYQKCGVCFRSLFQFLVIAFVTVLISLSLEIFFLSRFSLWPVAPVARTLS